MIQIVYHLAVIAKRRAHAASGHTPAERKILRSGKSLQRRIVLFSLIIVAATSILVAALISAQRNSALDRARFDAANLSAAFEEQVRQAINSASGAMDRLKGAVEARGLEAGLQDWVQQPAVESIPTQITVIGADGRVAASTADPALKSADLSDREDFQSHAANRHKGLYIGKPIRALATGRIRIPLTRRLEKPDGSFGGVLLASLYTEFLTGLYRSVDLGETGSLTLLGTDGAVRAYSSAAANEEADGASVAGSNQPGIPALRASDFDADGAYEMASPIDGVERLYHWRKVKGYPLIVIVGFGKPEALSAAHWQEAMVLGGGGVTLILAILFPFLLHREISKRIANEIDLNKEKLKLKKTNDALAAERKNLRAINRELKAEKRRAEHASNAKSIFLTNMSHEFRTPMHAILNYTNMCLRKIESEDRGKLQKYIENTRSAGLRLLRMLNAVLDLAKLEEGKIDLQFRKSDFLNVITETKVELGSLLEEKGLRVTADVQSENTIATFDHQRLVQVLVNLFSNAIKFSPPGRSINVVISDAFTDDGCDALQCSVADHGVGIPDYELGKIFDRFTQSSSAKQDSGAGLGLTICRELIELHGGKIWAANRSGGGAIISFMIPRQASSPIDGRPPAAKSEDAGPEPFHSTTGMI